ncbi:MAG TPA: FAD-dependent oxidoreductase [Solirubrobacteraceae bacterium]|nr:FAD-dependent oxidoreductase [Solirubrobacteraceae bacterium]
MSAAGREREPAVSECDVLVAGSGPAGLTAGLFAARHGRSTIVLGTQPGGSLLTIAQIDDFPGAPEGVAGYDLGPALQEQALAAGTQIEMAELERLEASDTGWVATSSAGRVVAAATVIVATGTRPRRLGVPGEDRLAGRGISHCASCDGPLHRGRTVVVVGGGDSALLEALELTEFAQRVVVVHRGGSLRAQAVYRERVEQHPKIQVELDTVVEEVLGQDRLAALRLRELGTGAESTFEASGLFVFVGGVAQPEFLDGLPVTDDYGHVVTDAAMGTALPGLFAAGSVRSKFTGQAVTAAGDGATAAVAAHRHLERGAPAFARLPST